MTLLVLSQKAIESAMLLAGTIEMEPHAYCRAVVDAAMSVRNGCVRVEEPIARWASARTAADACGLLREALKAIVSQEEPDGLTDRMAAFLDRHAALVVAGDPAELEARRQRDMTAVAIVGVKANGGTPTEDEWLTACAAYVKHRRIACAEERR